MVIETKVYKKKSDNYTIKKYRKKYNIKPGDTVIWNENKNNELVLTFRKKISFKDMKESWTYKN